MWTDFYAKNWELGKKKKITYFWTFYVYKINWKQLNKLLRTLNTGWCLFSVYDFSWRFWVSDSRSSPFFTGLKSSANEKVFVFVFVFALFVCFLLFFFLVERPVNVNQSGMELNCFWEKLRKTVFLHENELCLCNKFPVNGEPLQCMGNNEIQQCFVNHFLPEKTDVVNNAE